MKIFAPNAVLWALNVRDPAVRLERCEALGQLVEEFMVELAYRGDAFVGLVDALPPSRADVAIA